MQRVAQETMVQMDKALSLEVVLLDQMEVLEVPQVFCMLED